MRNLRLVLRLDAAATATMGVLLVALAWVLDGLLGFPVPLSVAAGAGLLLWAVLVARVSTSLAPKLVREVIAGNTLWVLASFGYVILAWSGLTTLGVLFVVAQATVVLALAVLQTTGLTPRPQAVAQA
ncbi:hypothetical protein SAMN05216266_111220 [Amycolatopsis marina]|uniref:Uncharacterized protein n=1 Tax=Amycolatopsis marina TaxID=490629 RepID=A0A1I1B2C9_9PSEU|nr:hypothetical protein [Amycolatopsis marina]SFB44519.1 hypothetical protein SAMN05216266_111220 [Amycolatopsis marina]